MLKPILIIPGFNGSLLVNNRMTGKETFLGKKINNNCVINLKNIYDPKNYKRIENYLIEPLDFGGINGIQNIVPQLEYIDNFLNNMIPKKGIFDDIVNYSYFKTLNDELITTYNYIPNESLFGLPYDYRFIDKIENRQTYFNKIEKKIMSSVYNNNNIFYYIIL